MKEKQAVMKLFSETGTSGQIIDRSFYLNNNVVDVARSLLGKVLCTNIDGCITSGIITETEAYAGVTDKASHAYGGRRSARTEIMYRQGGTAYVYLCYGMHSLFNVVTSAEGEPHAVLIRSVIPHAGAHCMQGRVGATALTVRHGTGPGRVGKLLGIHYSHSGIDLCKSDHETHQPAIWLQDEGISVAEDEITAGPRVGVGYAGEDALLPYRFVWLQKK